MNNNLRRFLRKTLSGKSGFVGFLIGLAVLGILAGQQLRQGDGGSVKTTSVEGEAEPGASSSPRRQGVPDVEVCEVDRCVDGDTIIVRSAGERVRVRFIGCNTPETVKKGTPVEPFGPEASAYTKKRIAEFGGIVTLKADGDRFDRYDRRLALVYLGRNGTVLLNEELLRLGLARPSFSYRYSEAIKKRYRAAQKEAQAEKRGIWCLDSADETR